MHLPRQRRLVATTDSDQEKSLLMERSREREVNVPDQLSALEIHGHSLNSSFAMNL